MTTLRAQTLTLATNRLAPHEPEDWRLDAACRDWDHERNGDPWHPGSEHPAAYDRARRICGDCPVTATCLEAAFREESPSPGGLRDGMRGGLTPAERAAIIRRERRAAS
ncbi:WhiB family transcriptional regulator [Oerskovia turbata]